MVLHSPMVSKILSKQGKKTVFLQMQLYQKHNENLVYKVKQSSIVIVSLQQCSELVGFAPTSSICSIWYNLIFRSQPSCSFCPEYEMQASPCLMYFCSEQCNTGAQLYQAAIMVVTFPPSRLERNIMKNLPVLLQKLNQSLIVTGKSLHIIR